MKKRFNFFLKFLFSMMPQQTAVYQNMMNNQQQNVYNTTSGNPTLNRTPSQTPMSMSNQQWPNNPTMNVGRQPQNAYNQVKNFILFCISYFLFYFVLKMMPPDPQQLYVQQQQQQQQQQQHYQ